MTEPIVTLPPPRDEDAVRRPGSRHRGGPGHRLRRAVVTTLAFVFSTVVLVAVAGGILGALMANGIVNIDVGGQIAAALTQRVGGGFTFAVGSTAMRQTGTGPSLTLNGLTVKDRKGRLVVAAPRAAVSVDPWSLLTGRVTPKRLELQDLVLHLLRLPDGTLALSAAADQAAAAGEAADLRITSLASTLAGPPAPVAATPPVSPPPAATGTTLPADVARAVAAATDALFDPGSVLRAVDRFGLENAQLVVDDQLRGQQTTYRNLRLDFDREPTGSIFVQLAADGPAGSWSGDARASRLPDGSRRIELAADRLSTDEILLAAGMRAAAFETDMPLSFSLDLDVGPDGTLRRCAGPVSFGAGYFRLDDPDHEPAMVDRMEGMLSLDPASGVVSIGKGVLVADATEFDFQLALNAPAGPAEPWALSGQATGRFGAERPGEKPIAFDKVAFASRFFAEEHRFVLDSARANGPEVAFSMNASVEPTASGFLVRSGMEMGRMPGQAVARLWPSWIAAPVRGFLLRNLQGGVFDYGRATLALTDADLLRMRNQHSVLDDHLHIEFGVSNGALAFMDGVPPLRGLDGTGLITGDTFTFTASKAEMDVSPGHKLAASEGSMTIASTDPKPTPAVIALRVTGAIDTLADLMAHDALKAYANLPIDSSAVAGSFDGRLTIGFRVGDKTPKDNTRIGVVATARDFSASKVIGKEGLQNATLAVTADSTGLHAKGDGRIFGAPAAIEIRKPAGGGPSEATLLLTLDEAARQRAGFGFAHGVTGPMTARITTSLTPADKTRAAVQLDFTRCAFDQPLPGLKKAADRPAKATFNVVQDAGRSTLDQIVFTSGATDIRGAAVLDQNGTFQSASLTQLRLSPGDDAKVEITRAGDGYKVVARATDIDARPFLRFVTGADSGKSASGDLDLDLHAGVLTGQNGQALTATDLHLVKRGTQLRKLQMTGRLGHGTIGVTTNGPADAPVVVVAAKDAGALLSFLDLYKRMDGGSLDATLRFADTRMDGSTVIHRFTIREDPAIKKLAEEQIPSESRNAGAHIDPSAVAFTKLEAQFTRTGNKVDVRQGSMYGLQVGATVEGSVDFAHDQVALSGTFVPIYGLNNLFSQIPVVGVLLGGGSHEGLFALNYRITGSASAPVMSFNPLSALAPGFLRKIFGAIDDAAQQGLDPQAHDAGGAPAKPPSVLPE